MKIPTINSLLRRALFAFWVVAAMAMAAPPGWAGEASAVKVRMVVKVSDRDKAADLLVRGVEKRNGYFLRKDKNGVTLRVPMQHLDVLVSEAGQQGQVIDRQLQREDLGKILLNKRAALKAKSEVQHQYLAILGQADTDGALYVEKELIKLVSEIETLKGQIRHLQHRMAFAHMEVRFDYSDRTAPVPDGRSSFAWLNTMNLSDLLKEF
jgi:hypothetical protein